MMFRVPQNSLSRRYSCALRRMTWKKKLGANGIYKVAPEAKTQEGGTCIYNAICSTMESHLRLYGYSIKLSVKDLIEKEQAFVDPDGEKDRTIRCFKVAKKIGICSDKEYEASKRNGTKWTGSTFKIRSYRPFMKLNEDALANAIESWRTNGPLLAEFYVDDAFQKYVSYFQQEGVLSYQAYNENELRIHAVCVLSLGVENIVPFWEYINSYGKFGKTKGYGRVVPHNIRRLFEIVIEVPKKRVRGMLPRDWDDTDDQRHYKKQPPRVPVDMGAAGNAFPAHTMDWSFVDPQDGLGQSSKSEEIHYMDID